MAHKWSKFKMRFVPRAENVWQMWFDACNSIIIFIVKCFNILFTLRVGLWICLYSVRGRIFAYLIFIWNGHSYAQYPLHMHRRYRWYYCLRLLWCHIKLWIIIFAYPKFISTVICLCYAFVSLSYRNISHVLVALIVICWAIIYWLTWHIHKLVIMSCGNIKWKRAGIQKYGTLIAVQKVNTQKHTHKTFLLSYCFVVVRRCLLFIVENSHKSSSFNWGHTRLPTDSDKQRE